MSDRATYLARVFVNRMEQLETALLDERNLTETAKTARQEEMILKILSIEEGITDGSKVRVVLSAMPRIRPGNTVVDREFDEFVTFLRRQLKI